VVLCGEDTARKKPDPEVYQRALAALALPARQTLAIEDSPAGAAAARAADIPVAVTRSAYFAHDTIHGAAAIGPGLDDRLGWQPAPADAAAGPVTLDDLRRWQRHA
jgi:beta-phosphoglucomutase-like phosphatase (HAD superfamily)